MCERVRRRPSKRLTSPCSPSHCTSQVSLALHPVPAVYTGFVAAEAPEHTPGGLGRHYQQAPWLLCARPMCSGAEGQYLSLQKLLEAFSSYSARAPNRYLRPVCRPDSPENARQWWQYAGAVARRQLRTQSFNWRQFERVRMHQSTC